MKDLRKGQEKREGRRGKERGKGDERKEATERKESRQRGSEELLEAHFPLHSISTEQIKELRKSFSLGAERR